MSGDIVSTLSVGLSAKAHLFTNLETLVKDHKCPSVCLSITLSPPKPLDQIQPQPLGAQGRAQKLSV